MLEVVEMQFTLY